jgi:endonuclease/exonuclease/phosphatase family metal-dependent hydrolase
MKNYKLFLAALGGYSCSVICLQAAQVGRSAARLAPQVVTTLGRQSISRALSQLPKTTYHHSGQDQKSGGESQRSSFYRFPLYAAIGSGIGTVYSEAKEQEMPRASIWDTIVQQGPMNKKFMIDNYVADCKKYAQENIHIPKHAKNNATVRIMTYNVFQWQSPYNRPNFENILTVIKDTNPDILVLQEVELFDKQKIEKTFSDLGYTAMLFCDAGGYWLNNPFGNLLFSKYPIKETQQVRFKKDQELTLQEKRCYIEATIELPGNKEVTIYGSHFDVWDDSGELRKAEVQELIDKTMHKKGNFLIAADFNSVRAQDYNYLAHGKKVWDILTESSLKRTGMVPSTVALDTLQQRGFVDSFTKAG